MIRLYFNQNLKKITRPTIFTSLFSNRLASIKNWTLKPYKKYFHQITISTVKSNHACLLRLRQSFLCSVSKGQKLLAKILHGPQKILMIFKTKPQPNSPQYSKSITSTVSISWADQVFWPIWKKLILKQKLSYWKINEGNLSSKKKFNFGPRPVKMSRSSRTQIDFSTIILQPQYIILSYSDLEILFCRKFTCYSQEK